MREDPTPWSWVTAAALIAITCLLLAYVNSHP